MSKDIFEEAEKRVPEQVKLTDFDRRTLSCSSPIVQVIDGKTYRIHDGYGYGYNQLVEPSKTLIPTL